MKFQVKDLRECIFRHKIISPNRENINCQYFVNIPELYLTHGINVSYDVGTDSWFAWVDAKSILHKLEYKVDNSSHRIFNTLLYFDLDHERLTSEYDPTYFANLNDLVEGLSNKDFEVEIFTEIIKKVKIEGLE